MVSNFIRCFHKQDLEAIYSQKIGSKKLDLQAFAMRKMVMKVIETELDGVLIIEPEVFNDARGHFLETYNQNRYRECGIISDFVQDNLSFSKKGTLRGLHYQYPKGQAKLVNVAHGKVYDVTVDIRKGSPSFGKWFATHLSEENKRQLFIPAGFAHGFYAVSDYAVFTYKCSDYYAPDCEGGVLWSDPDLSIDWPVKDPLISAKDAQNPLLKDILVKNLPSYIASS
jgi:dTDP-4-dehydrorhamnose 3,5-epimerase